MIVFDFIYFSIYSFVPDKAIFGKRDVACTLLSIYTAFLLLGLYMICHVAFNFKIHLLIICIVLPAGLIVLTSKVFLKPAKFRKMHRRFGKIPKWLLKTIGIMYILFCFVGLAFCGIQASFMVNSLK